MKNGEHRVRSLVVGGTGFIGSHLVRALAGAGHEVRALSRGNLPDPAPVASSGGRISWLRGDLSDPERLASAVEGCDVVYHLACSSLPQSSNLDPLADVRENVLPGIRLAQLAHERGVRQLVFISSGGTVYGRPRQIPTPEDHPTDPICSYGITKLAIEKYLGLFSHLNGLNSVVLRLSNPFGEGQRPNASQGVIAVFLAKALRGETIEIWGDGSVVRDYLYIGDAVDALIAAATYSGPERVFNIGSGRGTSLNDVLEAIETTLGRKVARRYLESRDCDVPASVLDVARAKSALGWQVRTPFLDGLGRMADWLRAPLSG